MKSIVTKLKSPGSKKQDHLVILVTFKDGSTKEMGIEEFKELSEKQYDSFISNDIISGNNEKEFAEYVDTTIKIFEAIANNPVPNRNIEDYL